MKLDNKKLIIILLALVILLVLARVFRTPGLESNQRDSLIKTDTAKVTAIHIYPVSEERKEIKLIRNGNIWTIQRDGKIVSTEPAAISNMLNSIVTLRAERMISRKKEKRNDYQVGDTTGTHVIIYAGSEVQSDWWVGRTESGAAYARLDDEDEIYVINSYLAGTFTRSFNDWRDKTFVKVNPDSITTLTIQYPADSGFVAKKGNDGWMIGQERADSTKMQNYLNRLRYNYLTVFVDNFTPPATPDVTITAEKGSVPVFTVKAWKKPAEDQWVLHSTQNPGVYFSSKSSNIIRDLLVAGKALK
jgi:hypothetical protein